MEWTYIKRKAGAKIVPHMYKYIPQICDSQLSPLTLLNHTPSNFLTMDVQVVFIVSFVTWKIKKKGKLHRNLLFIHRCNWTSVIHMLNLILHAHTSLVRCSRSDNTFAMSRALSAILSATFPNIFTRYVYKYRGGGGSLSKSDLNLYPFSCILPTNWSVWEIRSPHLWEKCSTTLSLT